MESKNVYDARVSIERDLLSDSNLIARGVGHYFKALGLKYGIFQYVRNREQAMQYIKDHNVPF